MKTKITYQKLIKNLHFIKNIPNAIPYVASITKKLGVFVCTINTKAKKKGLYEVYINSNFNENGSMSIGEILIKGKVKNEILLSTNICHPSMVSNELAGPVILNHIAKYYLNTNPYFSLRILFFSRDNRLTNLFKI